MKSPSFAVWYLKYHFVLVLILVPTYALNLGIVYLFALIKFQLDWLLSSIVIGDIVAYEVNVAFSVWLQIHWKYLRRLQMEAAGLEVFKR